ncbi:hypothetical protein [Psychrobacter piechaudii]|uniref:Uncharacterized protein n=1 Tax=Psychrobacter piechaudii TaxID=1945521 RepID=A0A1R4GG58_9GAMM|nr:hypothetical protein [Psychrobacter piechaudii]SJM67201.1 hypothetical protein A1232T_00422 [Psychrobacter piechaudii]
MGMFDYKNYSSEESAKLIDDASRLSAYTNAVSFFGFITGRRKTTHFRGWI